MRQRHHYLPLVEVQAGMVLGAPADAVRGGTVRFSLPAGHVLTEDNLHQLRAHQVEFIFTDEADTRTDQQVADDAAHVAHDVMQRFEGADLSDPVMMALFDQVLAFHSS